MARRDHTLYRDPTDQKLGGVCSGLARYFDVDTLLVRVAFVAALVFGGGSLIAYVLLWWLLDEAPQDTASRSAADDDRHDTPPVSEATGSTGTTSGTGTA